MNELIDLLAERKTALCGCCSDGHYPVTIGVVLSKMKEKFGDTKSRFIKQDRLVDKWESCGFTNSLQEIHEKAEGDCDYRNLKAQPLIDFLKEIFTPTK